MSFMSLSFRQKYIFTKNHHYLMQKIYILVAVMWKSDIVLYVKYF